VEHRWKSWGRWEDGGIRWSDPLVPSIPGLSRNPAQEVSLYPGLR
jgi:hypothetical protein